MGARPRCGLRGSRRVLGYGEAVVPDCCARRLGRSTLIDALDEAIGAIDKEIAMSVKGDETAKRLMTIPGVDPVTASAITARPGHGRLCGAFDAFRRYTRARPAAIHAWANHQDGRPLLSQSAGRGRCATFPPYPLCAAPLPERVSRNTQIVQVKPFPTKCAALRAHHDWRPSTTGRCGLTTATARQEDCRRSEAQRG